MKNQDANDDSGTRDLIELDPRNLKGLAHPLRLRILGALREFGPATSCGLAGRLGESSGATSYHLRQLAAFGFIEEDEGRGTKRERWWKAAHKSTYFDERSFGNDSESTALGAEFLRAVAGAHAARTVAWIDGLPDSSGAWRRAGAISDYALRLSPDELRSLEAELAEVIGRYRSFDPAEPVVPGTAMVAAQVQLLPRFPEAEAAPDRG
ncbi:MAG: winged helix-turn-helix domain-containing protein [Spirochaetes bacterium]|nr:winged helix-turn-helix domain-containing protein [Spirochaetota bacterium]MBU1079522.1 winged helix-turn-helix domain-containing protein [Spirochaetota bacterium]